VFPVLLATLSTWAINFWPLSPVVIGLVCASAYLFIKRRKKMLQSNLQPYTILGSFMISTVSGLFVGLLAPAL
jgi:hypothetical protein